MTKKLPEKSGKKTTTKKQGRPSMFSETVAQKIIELHGEGKTDAQVGEIIGVHEETIRTWRKKHETFRWASREAKLRADELVEASLFKKAIGFNYHEEQATKNGPLNLTKYHPPDTKAQIFWLKNRKPEDWRDKVEIEQQSNTSILLDTGDGEEEIPL